MTTLPDSTKVPAMAERTDRQTGWHDPGDNSLATLNNARYDVRGRLDQVLRVQAHKKTFTQYMIMKH